MSPGVPVKGPDPEQHPPRIHRRTPPGGDIRPSWRVIADLMALLGGDCVDEPLSGRWSGLRDLDPEGGGVSIL
jgi:NADH-quinone oxidoreductase subunit G